MRNATPWIFLLVAQLGVADLRAGNQAVTDSSQQQYRAVLSTVPVPEVVARAGRLLAEAPPEERVRVAASLIRVIAELAPTATPSAVSAFVRLEPGARDAVVAEGVEAVPRLRNPILRAAGVKLATETKALVVESGAAATTTTTAVETADDPTPLGTPPPDCVGCPNSGGNGSSGGGKKKGHYKQL